MFSKLKKIFKGEEAAPVVAPEPVVVPEPVVEAMVPEPPAPKPKAKKAKKESVPLTPKQLATKKKEPWVAVLTTHVNADDPRNGYFELDWNKYFVAKLRDAGYTGETDEAIVDDWFKGLCMAVAAENQEIVDLFARPKVQSKRNDDGTVEYT